MKRVAITYDDAVLEHAPDGYDPQRPEWTRMVKERLGDVDEGGMGFTHPERPERMEAVIESLRLRPIEGLDWLGAEAASRETLALVHTPAHLDYLESYRGRSGWIYHDTTAVSEGSLHAAEVAVGAACGAVEAVVRGDHRRSFALVRPPGHHAYADRSTGFCLLNNTAIAVEHARRRLGLRRIMVVDIDAHHGNGTQAFFERDPEVMHVDLHLEAPGYPGTGALFETGTGPGFGATINVPLPTKTGDAVPIEVMDAIVRPRAIAFQPELIVVSAGFDGHHADLLMGQSEHGFGALTGRLIALADLLTDGRIAWILEGGYRDALSVCVHACLEVMAGGQPAQIPLGGEDAGREALALAAVFHNRPVYAAAMAQAAAALRA